MKEQEWPGTVMAVSVFIALFTLLWLGRRTLVDMLILLRVLAVCCAVGNLLPYAWSGLRLGMEKLEWFFFNLLCIGPITVCLLLVMNHYVHGPVHWAEGTIGHDVQVEVVLDEKERDADDDAGEFPATRDHLTFDLSSGLFGFTDEEKTEAVNGRFRVGVARGCLGYWSITDVEVVR